MTRVFAPAKVNLTLHVTGQRADGYHLLDSLVMFADVGDRIDICTANTLSLTIEGPEAAGVPEDMSNSIMKAASLFKPHETGAAFVLTKELPSAAGIGGGSSDAAATLRGLTEHWQATLEPLLPEGLDPDQLSSEQIRHIAAQFKDLGADLPVCLFSCTSRMRGIGEELEFYRDIPALHAILVNPRVAVATPEVFAWIDHKTNPPMGDIGPFQHVDELINWLHQQRNDMEPAARRVAPVIGDVLEAVARTPGNRLARMSGSGATCFGLYDTADMAHCAAHALQAQFPGWWIKPARLGAPS